MIEEYELDTIAGKSLEANCRFLDVTPKQAKILNDMFFKKCSDYKFWEYVKDMDEPRLDIGVKDTELVKSYLCWQYGEVVYKPEYDKDKVKITSRQKALNEIQEQLGLTENLAIKYFKLNQEGYFDEEKKQKDFKVYWYQRAEIDVDAEIQQLKDKAK